jgi:hypothetical protein
MTTGSDGQAVLSVDTLRNALQRVPIRITEGTLGPYPATRVPKGTGARCPASTRCPCGDCRGRTETGSGNAA